MPYDTITVEEGQVTRITLNRPEMHNPFDERMIAELTQAFLDAASSTVTRAVVLTGAGKSFCAGADLNWMKRMGQYSREENLADAARLSAMFQALEDIPVPVMAKVNGAAFGGGAGLVCACDFAIASEDAKLGFSEVRLGLLPGVISPYVMDRVGHKAAVRLFTTGERLKAKDARKLNLIDQEVKPEELDAAVEEIIKMILAGGPDAVRACKRLARTGARMERQEFQKYCISAISDARASPEGKEGVTAFLEKREPKWRS